MYYVNQCNKSTWSFYTLTFLCRVVAYNCPTPIGSIPSNHFTLYPVPSSSLPSYISCHIPYINQTDDSAVSSTDTAQIKNLATKTLKSVIQLWMFQFLCMDEICFCLIFGICIWFIGLLPWNEKCHVVSWCEKKTIIKQPWASMAHLIDSTPHPHC